jgi:hypothetical protein
VWAAVYLLLFLGSVSNRQGERTLAYFFAHEIGHSSEENYPGRIGYAGFPRSKQEGRNHYQHIASDTVGKAVHAPSGAFSETAGDLPNRPTSGFARDHPDTFTVTIAHARRIPA